MEDKDLTHKELVQIGILEILEDTRAELPKEKLDGLIMLYIEIDQE